MIFRSNCCRLTAACACVIMMIMMMTKDAAAIRKSGHHSKSTSSPPGGGGSSAEWYPLQVEDKTPIHTGNIRHLGNSSISPWTDNVSFDSSRYPAYLAEARCSLQGCLDSEGEEDLNLESRPIMRQVLLLRRVKPVDGAGPALGNHSYHYRLESRVIAVGCTCVRPSVLHQH